MRIRLALAGVLALVGVPLVALPAAAAGSGLYHYAVHADSVGTFDVDPNSSPCGTPGTVTFNQHMNAAVAATEPRLTDQDVLGLLDADPDGVLKAVTSTTTGTVVYTTAGHTYTGTFTSWFGGQFLPNGMYIQTGTFSLRAESETGSLLLVSSGGHDVDGFDGTTKMFTSRGSVRGCQT